MSLDIRKLIVTLAAFGLALGMACPAGALTLQPGQYKTEWRVPSPEEAVDPPTKMGALEPIGEDQLAKLKGLKSKQPVWATIEGSVIVLDNSGGASTNFDLAYILPSYKPGDSVDFSSITPMKIESRQGIPTSPVVPTDVTVGREGASLIEKGAMRVRVVLRQGDSGGSVAVKVAVTTYGNWFAKIPTDEGEVELQLVDKNANGAFDDKGAFDPRIPVGAKADMIAIRRAGGQWERFALTKTLLYQSKLYTFSVTPTGDRVDIQPYSGPTGALRLVTRDGKNNMVETGDVANFMSDDLGVVQVKVGAEVTVPIGDYRCCYDVVFGARKKKGDPGFIATISNKRLAKVESGKTTTFAIGGPIKIIIEPEDGAIMQRSGPTLKITLRILAGEDSLDSLGLPEPKVTLDLSDANGQRIGRAQMNMGFGNSRFFVISMGRGLIQGSYWLTVSMAPGEYAPGETITAHKQIKITAM